MHSTVGPVAVFARAWTMHLEIRRIDGVVPLRHGAEGWRSRLANGPPEYNREDLTGLSVAVPALGHSVSTLRIRQAMRHSAGDKQ